MKEFLKEHPVVTSVATAAAVGALVAGGVQLNNEPQEAPIYLALNQGGDADASDTSTTTAQEGIDGTVTAGDDATIRTEDAAGLYECGGVKNETWKNEDGSDKPFTPDAGLIPHMNAHPELAESDEDFWVNVMGAEAFDYLAANVIPNNKHDEDAADLEVEGVSASYEAILENQVAAPVQEDVVALNHACVDKQGNYYVRSVNYKHLIAGETTLTGNVLSEDDYEEFTELYDGDVEDELVVSRVDTDGDGENDAVHVGMKHQQCGNNELRTDTPVPTPEQPETPDTPGGTTPPAHPSQPPQPPQPPVSVNPKRDTTRPTTPGETPGTTVVPVTEEPVEENGTANPVGGTSTTVKPSPSTTTPPETVPPSTAAPTTQPPRPGFDQRKEGEN